MSTQQFIIKKSKEETETEKEKEKVTDDPLGYAFAIDFTWEHGLFLGEDWFNIPPHREPFVYKKVEDAYKLMKMIKKNTSIEVEQDVTCIVAVAAYYTKEEENKLRTLDNRDEMEEIRKIEKFAFN